MNTLSCTALRVVAGDRVLVEGASFAIAAGEVVGIVGASGSGKTLLLRSILDLVPPPARRVGGEIRLDGCLVPPRSLRGQAVGLLFQDARASLDPLSRLGRAVAHAGALGGKTGVDPRTFLFRAGFVSPSEVLDRYPHELSGGMAQRAAIACALARGSRFLLCDEPTTGLDAHVQVSLLAELRSLAADGHGIAFVTHDVALLEDFADRVLVMEAGRFVDEAASPSRLAGPGRALVEAASQLRRPA